MSQWPIAKEILKWNQLVTLLEDLRAGEWMFRGQPLDTTSLDTFGLKTALERVSEGSMEHSPRIEAFMLREFQRRAHHYLSSTPDETDTLEWFAMMQHYGVPTRLQDWTYSPYVAAFFALESGAPGEIWAINRSRCLDLINQVLQPNLDPSNRQNDYFKQDGTLDSRSRFNELILLGSHALVAPVAPLRMNERLTIQQGLFLCPSNATKSFQENLSSIGSMDDPGLIRRFTIKHPDQIVLSLQALFRMNMSRASLFPGLEGFSQSLRSRILTDKDYVTGTDWVDYHKKRLEGLSCLRPSPASPGTRQVSGTHVPSPGTPSIPPSPARPTARPTTGP